jgi:uncharacterized protein
VISALLIGLAGSMHCLGMCSPLQAAFIGKESFSRYFIYHIGRIFSYGVLGSIVGLLIEVIDLFILQQYISIISGVIIISFVFIKRIQNELESFFSKTFVYQFVINRFSALSNKKGILPAILKGMLNGLLPCGLVYVALIASLNESHFWFSGLYMIMFGLGTIPLLLASNLLLKRIQFTNAYFIRNFLVSFVGILFILRGLGLGIPYLSPSIHSHQDYTEVSCH